MTDDTKTQKIIVVLGATGQQGGAVTRALAADGRWRIRTISRNPDSDAARRLTARGIEVVAGDMDDAASLRRAFEGAHGAFSVQGADNGGDVETRRGIAVAEAAKAAGIVHFIYSSVGGADRRSGVPHFESKWRVEEYVREIGLPASIVRPAFFMDNFTKPAVRMILMSMLRAYVPKAKALQMIAVEDIGKWVAHAFAHPEAFIGKAEEIAGDELTCRQIVSAFKLHGWSAGLPIPLPRLAFRPFPYDARKMMQWFGTGGYTADISTLRARHPDLKTFDQWLSEQSR